MSRPRVWQPLTVPNIQAGYEYRATDGAIRSGAGNVLETFTRCCEKLVRISTLSDDGGIVRLDAPVNQLIAFSVHGIPEREFSCSVCGKNMPPRISHRNGDWRDCSPQNLVFVPNLYGHRDHEAHCLERLMVEPSRTRSDTGEHPNGSPSPWPQTRGPAPERRRPSLVEALYFDETGNYISPDAIYVPQLLPA